MGVVMRKRTSTRQDCPGDVALRQSRRGFFHRAADGVHGAALTYLLGRDVFAQEGLPAPTLQPASGGPRPAYDLSSRETHFPARARSVIHLFMNGGPSQVDLFDPKPALDRMHGQSYFSEIAQDVSSPQQAGGLLRSPYKFAQYGESGTIVSEVMPHLARQVDEIAVIRSMYNSHPNHEPALFKIHSGRLLPGRPALGAWVVYGLGTENQSLPAYVVLDDPRGLPVDGIRNWSSGWLPPQYQGTRFRAAGTPVWNLIPTRKLTPELAAARRALLARLDRAHRDARPGETELDARIGSYELAARMQLSATAALDVSRETQATQDLYGLGNDTTDSYGRRCLLARRLVERGVRYVQLFINGQIWDNHTGLESGLRSSCARTDRPVAALLTDLKQRGMLDETLVIWGGEFGRLPISQSKNGRDHNRQGFTVWLAGGGWAGVRAGQSVRRRRWRHRRWGRRRGSARRSSRLRRGRDRASRSIGSSEWACWRV